MSDQYANLLNRLAEKLDEKELGEVKYLINALELNQDMTEEISEMMTNHADNALKIAADEFALRVQAQEERGREIEEEVRKRIELSQRMMEPLDSIPPASSIYDPHGELKPVPVTLIAGDDTPAQHFTSTNVKQFIEKRLSLALVALQNSHSLNEPTTANLSDDQDEEEPAIETIALYVEYVSMLLADIADTSVVVLED